MTTGALIFAYNNQAFDYVGMAAWSAANIRRHLGIPVAVVTDKPTDLAFDRVIVHDEPAVDSRWFTDIDQRVSWNNRARCHAWDLTPWDRTLLLDADYVVASDRLGLLLDGDRLLCHDRAIDVTGQNDFHTLNHFGRYHMFLWWATVVVFSHDDHARHVFDCMKMIRDNWSHYKNIYQDRSKTYRNDHALSIAINIVNGHQTAIDSIPWDLATVLPEYQVRAMDQDTYRIDFSRTDGRKAWMAVRDQDLHVMGKQSLQDMIT